ncbi:MAG: nitroreductase family deazaflavin-dependent oxidoreductase [Myxococcales bacterium]|nr:MAG: nitroreductase family deazaflavin-dependent oxidoreductase [Myxococcales bacterium]
MPRPFTASEEKFAKPIIRVMSKLNAFLYRSSGGRVWSKWLRGAPIMLLTTTGRKSAKSRTAPLLYLADGDRIIIVASQGGMSTNPAWYLNLEANPACEVQIGNKKCRMRARRATDDEKADYWPRLTSMYRDFDDYQARTERNIPVVILSPA